MYAHNFVQETIPREGCVGDCAQGPVPQGLIRRGLGSNCYRRFGIYFRSGTQVTPENLTSWEFCKPLREQQVLWSIGQARTAGE